MTHRVFEDLLASMQVRDRQMLASFLRCFDASVDTISHKLAKTFKHGSMDAMSNPISLFSNKPIAKYPIVPEQGKPVPKPFDIVTAENNRRLVKTVINLIPDDPENGIDLFRKIDFILSDDASPLFDDFEDMREFLLRYGYAIVDNRGRDQYGNRWEDVNIAWQELLNDEDPMQFLQSYILFMNEKRHTDQNAEALAIIVGDKIDEVFEDINENLWLSSME